MLNFRRLWAGLVLLVCFWGNGSAWAAASHGGIVLALSGGGTKGLAHIGVLQVLEEYNIPVAGIVGTSMGAIIGGLASSGYKGIELEEAVNNIDLGSLLSERASPMFLPLGEREGDAVPWISIIHGRGASGPLGGFSGVKLLEKFAQMASRVQIVHFNELPIPFAAVATDLETGKKVVLTNGSLASAMRASMAIPGLFEPWAVGGRLLVDGGLVSNLPVKTAKELFPGYPIIAVNVTKTLKSREDLRTVVDVVDQSITVLTQQNVETEERDADLLLVPDVGKMPLFDASRSEEVIEAGREVAMAHLKEIQQLSEGAPLPLYHKKESPEIVTDVCLEGLPDTECRDFREKYRSWIGKPVNTLNVMKASKEISKRIDVLAVDYRLEEKDAGTAIIFTAQRRPLSEFRIGGYTTNLHPYRWLFINSIYRDIYNEGDSIKLNLKVGKQWAADLGYLSSPEVSRAWELHLSGQKWEVTPGNSSEKSWERYSAGVVRHFTLGKMQGGAGLGFENVHSGGMDENALGPTFYVAYNTLDDLLDPTRGSSVKIALWWPDYDELLYRVNVFHAMSLSENWRLYLRGGYAEGDVTEASHAVYLGAAEELYSYANYPIEAERMAWFNLALRRIFLRSWWGNLSAEFFGGAGWAYDDRGERADSVWETGISLSAPGRFFDGRLMFLYNDRNDFKVGFFIGKPIWGHHPLP
jgi:NTE family protein